jgi:signal transduction histidine kinase
MQRTIFPPTAPIAIHERPWMARYAVSVVTIAVAALLRWLLQKSVEGETPFLLLFAGVLVSATFGGLGPGALATVLAALSSTLLFNDVNIIDGISAAEAARLLLFLFEGLFISVLGARLQAARQRAELSEAQARFLEQKILDISDAERRRIGQDLHDGLGQHLTGVAFLSKALQQRLSSKSMPEAADATKIAMLVTESIGQTRALAKGLAPVGLEDGGLPSALMQLAAATTSVFNVPCHCHCDQRIGSHQQRHPTWQGQAN